MIDLAKILVVFALMLILLNRKVNLGLVMAIAAVTLGVLFRMDALSIGEASLVATTDPETLKLLVVLILIMFLENIMRKTMVLQRMVNALKELIPDHRLVMAIMPAFIGLLPSPGGAMFSAPMVGEASRDMALSPERKSFINYWYRHIWEYMFPLYPSIILASNILSVPLRDLMILQFPFSIMAVLAGIPVAFRGTKSHSAPARSAPVSRCLLDLLVGIGPITLVIVMVLLFNIDIVFALALAVVGLIVINRYDFRRILGLREAFSMTTVLLVVGVMIFKEVLERSGAVDTLPAFAATYDIPPAVLVFALPFVVGLLTGWAQAFVGVVFPVLLGLLAAGTIDMRLVAFGFASGFAGVMLSPAHLCLVLTIQHFKADFGRVQLMLLLPELVVVSAAAALYLPR